MIMLLEFSTLHATERAAKLDISSAADRLVTLWHG